MRWSEKKNIFFLSRFLQTIVFSSLKTQRLNNSSQLSSRMIKSEWFLAASLSFFLPMHFFSQYFFYLASCLIFPILLASVVISFLPTCKRSVVGWQKANKQQEDTEETGGINDCEERLNSPSLKRAVTWEHQLLGPSAHACTHYAHCLTGLSFLSYAALCPSARAATCRHWFNE